MSRGVEETIYDQADNAWHTHVFPPNHDMCWILALQGGGSGGRGRNELSGARNGGGGGGSGPVAIWEGPIIDDLEIFLPLAASGASAGADGLLVYVAIGAQSTSQEYELLRSANANSGSGSNGTGGSGGAAGSAGSAYSTVGRYTGMGVLRATAGSAGTAGGSAGAAGTALTPAAAYNRTGGSGGGGCTSGGTENAGGAIIASGDISASAGGTAGAGAGVVGAVITDPWLGKGGTGGGGSSSTTGGNGGHGTAPGCGGGGGGGGTGSAGAGSTGGDGGPPLVIVRSWSSVGEGGVSTQVQPYNDVRITTSIVSGGSGTTGLTVTATLRRTSDGQYLQSAGGWGASPSNLTLTQVDATNVPGLYTYATAAADIDPSDEQYIAKISESSTSLLEYIRIVPVLPADLARLMLALRQQNMRFKPSTWDSTSKQPTAGVVWTYANATDYDADTTPDGTGSISTHTVSASFTSGQLTIYGSKRTA